MTGMAVIFARRGYTSYARPPQWEMLRLFAERLESVEYAALRAPPGDMAYSQPVSGPVHFLTPYAERYPWRAIARLVLHRQLARLIPQFEYLYVRLPSPTGLVAAQVARDLGVPYWVSLHGDPHENVLKQSRLRPLGRRLVDMHAGWVREATARAIQQSCHSFFVGSTLAERYGQGSVASTVFANLLHDSKDVCLTRPQRPTARRILFVGSLSPRKGLNTLLQAMLLPPLDNRDIQLRIVGRGSLLREIERFCEREALAEKVSIAGWKQHGSDMDQEYAEADLLVLPSSGGEGVPKVIAEAMTRRLPVVATDVGSVRDLLGDQERGWLVAPGDPHALAAALAAALDSGAERKSRSDAAAEHMRKYSREHWRTKIAGALAEIDARVLRADA